MKKIILILLVAFATCTEAFAQQTAAEPVKTTFMPNQGYLLEVDGCPTPSVGAVINIVWIDPAGNRHTGQFEIKDNFVALAIQVAFNQMKGNPNDCYANVIISQQVKVDAQGVYHGYIAGIGTVKEMP